jgi:integral membrane sensor domain MASE1
MIRSIYLDFGFFPTLLICVGLVLFFITWMAGIAGMIANPDRKKDVRFVTLALCVLVPPVPVIWLYGDIIREKVKIRRHSKQKMKEKGIVEN